MPQTTTKQYQDLLVSGQITRSGEFTDTAVSEDTGDIKIEDLLLAGTAKKGADLPAAAFLFPAIYGVVIRDSAKAQKFRTGGIVYEEDDHIPVLRKGYMAVTLTGTVAKGANLFFVHTAGGASALHTWRGDADTARASKTPITAVQGGGSGDIIEVLVNIDMGIGVV